jgi:hypothetical protein
MVRDEQGTLHRAPRRWHLVDNAMAPYCHQDTNYYARDNGATATSYVRDSYLDHIDYGLVDPNANATAPVKSAT